MAKGREIGEEERGGKGKVEEREMEGKKRRKMEVRKEKENGEVEEKEKEGKKGRKMEIRKEKEKGEVEEKEMRKWRKEEKAGNEREEKGVEGWLEIYTLYVVHIKPGIKESSPLRKFIPQYYIKKKERKWEEKEMENGKERDGKGGTLEILETLYYTCIVI